MDGGMIALIVVAIIVFILICIVGWYISTRNNL